MPDFWNGYPVIEDRTDVVEPDLLFPRGFGRGFDPTQYVPGMLAPPSDMVEIPESEYDARIDEQEAQGSSLEHVWRAADNGRTPLCLDQNGQGFCWAYSCGSAMMVQRAKANQRFVRLNPHSVASIVKNGRDEGGWCGLSLQKVGEIGMAEEGPGPDQWPVHSMDYRRFDDPAVKASMLKYRTVETWQDLTKQPFDRALTSRQLFTVLLGQNSPCQVDFEWWGHSVCAIRVVRVEAGRYGLMILNSWKDWGKDGMSVLTGEKMKPMGAVCPRSVVA